MGKHFKKDVGAIVHSDGVSFRVWAPFAANVAVTGTFNNWSETPLENEKDGYWAGFVDNAEAGHEYKYVINTGTSKLIKNDPRAMQLTTNVGNGVIVDLEFDWEGDDFQPPPKEQQVIYELHIGTFNRPDPSATGTFNDAIDKLDHLAGLGINMVELMPVASMPSDKGWGYAVDYIYAVESLYGGRHGFLKFVKEAHKRGIGVIVDVVYNHFGPDNLDLWQFDGWNQNGKGGIFFYNDWRSTTPWGDTRPDYGRLEVQQYILDNVRMWLNDCHVDGLRMDSTIFIRNVYGHNDDPATDMAEAWSLLQDINKLAPKIKPTVITIAEDVGVNSFLTKAANEGGAGFASQWGVTFPSVLRSALEPVYDADRNLNAIVEELTRYFNGDAFQRIAYSDSHDSAANGASRLPEEISPGRPDSIFARQRSLLAAAIVLTAPGVPMLLQGQEIMQGGSFNDWEGLDWDKAERHKGIITAYRHLIALRRNSGGVSAGLQGQSIKLLHVDHVNKVLAYHRWSKGGPRDDVVVIINFSNQHFDKYDLPFPVGGHWRVRFNSSWKGYSEDFKGLEVSEVSVENGQGTLALPPYAALILSQDS